MTRLRASLLVLFVVTLLAGAALAWLTSSALRLERAELDARRRAEVEQRTHLALWRMESVLARLLVDEASRPPEFYLRPSPHRRAEGVFLHVAIDGEGNASSPDADAADSGRLAAFGRLDGWRALPARLARLHPQPVAVAANSWGKRAQYAAQNVAYDDAPSDAAPPAGQLTPLWLGDALVLARSATAQGEAQTQLVWLDWPILEQRLVAEVRDLLPEARLLPSAADRVDALERRLASLPVELEPGALPVEVAPGPSMTPMLAAAWAALLVALLSVGALLLGAVALGERRAAFVSAVTHELRTPLTTFRIYAEMLAEGMVRDEAQRAEYHETLRREADRLSHLVENVLAYARLEKRRAPQPTERLAVAELYERCRRRLDERALGGELLLEASLPADLVVMADPAAVEQILFNLVDNACKYARTATDRQLRIAAEARGRLVAILVEDHGPGVAADVRARLFEPFAKSSEEAAASAPGVGLGLALSRGLARALGGDLVYEPREQGARFALLLRAG